MHPSASKSMKSILILIGFICIADETNQPQCSLVQEHFDSIEQCNLKVLDSVDFLQELNIKHYSLSCKPWHYPQQHSSKL